MEDGELYSLAPGVGSTRTEFQPIAIDAFDFYLDLSCDVDRKLVQRFGNRYLVYSNERSRLWQKILTALGSLFVAGTDVQWQAFDRHYVRSRVALPTYPFQRKHVWVENAPFGVPPELINIADPGEVSESQAAVTRSIDDRKDPLAECFWEPVWQPVEQSVGPSLDPGLWVLFADEHGIASQLAERLRQLKHSCVLVHAGRRFQQLGHDEFVIDPAIASDYANLHERLQARDRPISRVVHLWTSSSQPAGRISRLTLETAIVRRHRIPLPRCAKLYRVFWGPR